ncbi:MAG: hypothetical protein ACKOGB_01065, partial [Betaproteobacteria bacterium]
SPMTSLLNIAWASAWHRRFALSLVVLCLALSTFLLLTVERVRHDVRENFSNAVSGTDLIVGARSGAVQLMLYSVFRMGQPTQTIEYSISCTAPLRAPTIRSVPDTAFEKFSRTSWRTRSTVSSRKVDKAKHSTTSDSAKRRCQALAHAMFSRLLIGLEGPGWPG